MACNVNSFLHTQTKKQTKHFNAQQLIHICTYKGREQKTTEKDTATNLFLHILTHYQYY